jgi:methylated-DNA-[protein]-cysteine S-methyltransferase
MTIRHSENSSALYESSYATPIGQLHLRATTEGLLNISLEQKCKQAQQNTHAHLDAAKLALDLFFEAKPFKLPKLNWSQCTPFQKRILQQLSKVKFGQTLSYSKLASLSGHPGAARAVGSCMRFNPWPLLVPCHRIIPTSGGLGNYSLGGPAIKSSLLEMEKTI